MKAFAAKDGLEWTALLGDSVPACQSYTNETSLLAVTAYSSLIDASLFSKATFIKQNAVDSLITHGQCLKGRHLLPEQLSDLDAISHIVLCAGS